MDFFRINNTPNGMPRYVVHFKELLTPAERDTGLTGKYPIAIARSNAIGGRKFHNKQFGGGIVFKSFEPKEIESRINTLLNNIK